MILVLLTLATFILYLPLFINPSLFLERGNDLSEFFWPIYYFVKDQILNYHTFPLWNNVFLSGTPLLPDPQSPLFYLPNILYLILSLRIAFLFSAFLHTLLGGFGIYLLAKHTLKLKRVACLLAGVFYILSPHAAGFIEAGHVGLIAATAWLPWVLLAITQITEEPRFKWSFILAISMAGLFFTHTTTFIWAVIISPFIIVISLLMSSRLINRKTVKSIFYFLVATSLTVGLTAISFLPQMAWSYQTTRVLLNHDKQVFPIWFTYQEYFKTIFFPWLNGTDNLRNIATEKWIPVGITIPILALVGFVKAQKKIKITSVLILLAVLLWSLNNRSPIDFLLIEFDWFVFSRVATRIWPLAVFVIYLLAAFGFQKLTENRYSKFLALILTFLAIFEIAYISIAKSTRPIPPQTKIINSEIYSFLEQDSDQYRVFCLNRCIPQGKAAEHRLELVEGYSTLQQINYYQQSQKLVNSSWDYYTLSIPPIGTYLYENIQPNANALGKYNTKYVISPHPLTDSNFLLRKTIGDYLVYENKLFLPRATAPVVFHSPNLIKIDTSSSAGQPIILSEIYNSDWKAFLNGQTETTIEETTEGLRKINIGADTKYLEVVYQPKFYRLGKIISLTTILILAGYASKSLYLPLLKKLPFSKIRRITPTKSA